MSGTASRIGQSLIKLRGVIARFAGEKVAPLASRLFGAGASEKVSQFGAKLGDMSARVGKTANAIGSKVRGLISLASELSLVWSNMVMPAVQAALGAIRAVMDAQQFKQSTMFAFRELTGSAAGAEQAWSVAEQIALRTGNNLQETAGAINSLLAQGFRLPQAEQLVKQMADLKALNPAADLDGITRALAQIKATGKLQGDELMQLNNAGLSTDKVYQQLEKRLGKTREELLKMQAAGKISANDAIAAVQDALSAQTGRPAGALAEELAASTLAGSLGKLRAVRDVLLSNAKIDFSPLSRFLDKLSTALQGDAGKRLSESLSEMFAGMVSFFGRLTAEDIVLVLDSIGAAARAVGAAFNISGQFVYSFIYSIQALRSWGAAVSDWISSMTGSVTSAANALGGNIVDGIVAGIVAGANRVASAVSSVSLGGIAAGAASILSASPSKLAAREIGMPIPQGAAVGIEQGSADMADAAARMSTDSIATGAKAAQNVRSTTNNSRSFAPQVTVNVNGGGGAGGIVGAMEDALRSLNNAFA